MSPNQPFSFELSDRSLDLARVHARNGRLADAESAYREVLNKHPDQVEALRFIANAALSHGNAGEAVALLSRAVQADRSNTAILLELGLAYRNAQRMDEARSVFELALEQSHGRNTAGRLMLANVLELDNRPDMALLHYFRAILDAQSIGQWLNDATTEPGLRNMVRHAMQYVATHRREWFEHALEPLRAGTDIAHFERINAALAGYLREQPWVPDDPEQRPSFLYLAGLGSQRFLENGAFEWLDGWARRVAPLDAEALACIEDLKQSDTPLPLFSLTSIVGASSPGAAPAATQWAVLCQRGAFQDSIQHHAPRMSRLLESAPLVHIPDYAPDAAILALPPTTRTPPRHGRTNAFCTVVMAFSESAPVMVTVGGETRRLQAAEALAFDSSFAFSFATDVDAHGLVLAFDVWNPNVPSFERDALGALATAAVAFDRQLEDLV